MKQASFDSVLGHFDRFKLVYDINRANKRLYRPQILWVLIKGMMVLLVMALLFGFLAPELKRLVMGYWATGWTFRPLLLMGLAILLIAIFMAVIGAFIEAGFYHMYYASVQGNLKSGDFSYGMGRYGLRFLIGKLLVALFWFLAAIPYVFLGALTLSVGFAIIPILVDGALLMWQVIVVTEDTDTLTAIKKSIDFAKTHVPAVLALTVLYRLLMLKGGSGQAGNFFQWQYRGQDMPFSPSEMPSWMPDVMTGFSLLYAGLTAVVVIMTIGVGLVQMVFSVFFGLCVTQWYTETLEVGRAIL